MENITSQKRLPVKLLKDYINTFYGYGRWAKSNFWFVGIEEGGGNEFESVNDRLRGWKALGGKSLVDKDKLHEYFSCNYDRFTHKSATWQALITTKLSFENKSTEKNEICLMKGNDWGQLHSNNLLIELFPLPSPKTGDWKYEGENWVDTDIAFKYLKNRKVYHAELRDQRINYLKNKIEKHRPKVVLFYGLSMKEYWNEIIGTDLLQAIDVIPSKQKTKFIKINNICYFQCPHPAIQFGRLPNKYWIGLGNKIKELCNG